MGQRAAGGSAGRSGAGPRSEGSLPPLPLRSSASTPVTALGAGSPYSPSPLSAAIPRRPLLDRSQDPRDRYVGPGSPPVLPPAPHSLGPREGALSCPGSQARACSWLPGLPILPGGALAPLLPSAFFLPCPPEMGWAVRSSSLALCVPSPCGHCPPALLGLPHASHPPALPAL